MIVGFSGKKQSGKNTSAEIWQLISTYYSLKEFEDTTPKESLNEFIFKYLKLSKENVKYLAPNHGSNWIQKSYAKKLKQIVCLLIGCTIEQLEDNEFKKTPIGESWNCWVVTSHFINDNYIPNTKEDLFLTKEQAEIWYETLGGDDTCDKPELRQITPRLLLQLLGTQCGRDIIHPEIWVNALFADYKLSFNEESQSNPYDPRSKTGGLEYPNWLVTDCRFPNEIEAIKEKEGITIRINREYPKTSKEWQELFKEVVVLDPDGWDRKNYKYSWEEELISLSEYYNRIIQSTCKFNTNIISNLEFYFTLKQDTHPSETSLDDYNSFDYVINNPTGSIEYLIDEIKKIMIKEKVINV